MDWHSLSVEEALRKLKTSKEGLSSAEAKKRLEKFGKNQLPEKGKISSWKIFFWQFKSPLVYILIIAGIVTLILKEYIDFSVIFAAVFLNIIVGFIQEKKASDTLYYLQKIVRETAYVIRKEREYEIDSSEVAPGDIVILSPGNKVPADGRLIENHNLRINEAPLTGEWLSAEKTTKTLPKETPLADRDNMVYMGCEIVSGKGTAVITQTGIETEIGKIAKLVKETPEEKTPYQKKLSRFSRIIGYIILAVCLLIFIEGLISGREPLYMFETAVAIAVSAIPEGLPVAMTIILALGIQRILKKKGLIRKLVVAETLGSTSIICTDKTGTLTQGKMRVTKVLSNTKDENLIFKIASLCNEAFIENPEDEKEKWLLKGSPTDKAVFLFALKKEFRRERIEKEIEKFDEMPFDNVKKFLARLYRIDNKNILFVSGAPERIIKKSNLPEKEKEEWIEKLEKMAGKGFRILALAKKEIKGIEIQDSDFYNLELVALLCLSDPLRKKAEKIIEICRQAGMRPILVTGDHLLTAKTIGKEIGLKTGDENIIEGSELDKLSKEEFRKKIEDIDIYARVEPKHKMRIIKTWQRKGEIVAMTGDGINDVPALKRADIGVAMGSGTDVAKGTGDLILLTDNFNIIVQAIKEGRAILDNIRKVITYLLADSFTEVILVGVSILARVPLPISPLQILWVNLIGDGLPDIALAFEPKEKGLMTRKPEPKTLPLLSSEMKIIIFAIGALTDIILLGIFFWLFGKFGQENIDYIRTMVFAALATDSLFYVLSCRNLHKPIWKVNPFKNPYLNFAIIFSFLMLFLTIYTPFLQGIFETVPLSLNDWMLIVILGIIEIILVEITKWHFIHKKQLTPKGSIQLPTGQATNN